ncbi:hypothetical protein GCM10023197_06990 [Gordonia humi]
MDEDGALGGERRTDGRAFEQWHAELTFETRDGPARVRLGDAACAGGRAEAAVIVDADEQFECSEVERS